MSEKPVCKNNSGACDHPLACGSSGRCYWSTGIDTGTEVDTGNRTFMNEASDAVLHGPADTPSVGDIDGGLVDRTAQSETSDTQAGVSGVTVAAENNEVELLRDLNDSLTTELKELSKRYNKLLLSRPSMESMVETKFKQLADQFRSGEAGSYMNLEIDASISHNGSGFDINFKCCISGRADVRASSLDAAYYEAVARYQRDEAMKPKRITYSGHEDTVF